MSSGDLNHADKLTLKELDSALGRTNRIRLDGCRSTKDGLLVALDLDTSDFHRVEGGLPVEREERLWMLVSPIWPYVPPLVEVDHQRWDGYPHVLLGRRLCLYLDPAAEWNPTSGWEGFLERLWNWFDDAIAARFNPATALYHPVGGVLHRSQGTPTVVVTSPLDPMRNRFRAKRISLRSRTKNRIDVVAWHRTEQPSDTMPGLLIVLSDSLPRGAGTTLSDLAIAIRGQDARHERREFLATVLKAGRALRSDQHLYAIVAVPNPHLEGEQGLHLIGWRLPQSSIEAAVGATRSRHRPEDPRPEREPELEWTFVDDCRPTVTTRRDTQRPVTWYAGKTVEVWGCGALGSWLSEHVARADARSLVLRDNGYVNRGLLVRQNYTEKDTGQQKVSALARRLETVSDHLEVRPIHGPVQAAAQQGDVVDVVFDCTVNTSVAFALREAQTSGRMLAPVAQLATDLESATLGILTVTSGHKGDTSDKIDLALRQAAESDPELRPFKRFWDRDVHAPIVPTLGCSIPTFVGSSADAQAVAGTAVSLAATALDRNVAAGYLFALPYALDNVRPFTHVPLS